MPILRLLTKILAYDEGSFTTNPSQNYVNWAKDFTETVEEPGGQTYQIAAGDSLTVFNGTVTTAIANDTQFTLTLSPLSADRYRFTHSGGTAPGLRTNRNIASSGKTFTIVVNANQTISMTASVGGTFAAAQVGDILFIPGVVTGDVSSPFNSLNQGFWLVLAKDGTNTTLSLSRLEGEVFEGYSEAGVVVASNTELQVFSAAGVQVGDSILISNGFPASVQRSYVVDQVTSDWFEVIESLALPINVSGIPTVTGIAFYNNGKRLVFVDATQECVVRANGATDDTQRLSPWSANNQSKSAIYLKIGLIWQLVIVNKSSETLKVFVATVQ